MYVASVWVEFAPDLAPGARAPVRLLPLTPARWRHLAPGDRSAGGGLALGVTALAQIRRTGERGKGMAIAGSVLSSVGLVLWALALFLGSATDFWDDFEDAANGEGTACALAVGDCFDTPTGSLLGDAYDVDEVSCAGGHGGEVFAVVTLPGGSFPGNAEVGRTADAKCYALQAGYAVDPWVLPDDVGVYYLVPSRESWRTGDREITCLFGNAADDGGLTGSLRGDPALFDADQTAFLSAANAVDTVLYEEPEDYAEDDLAANRAWVGDMDAVLGEQIEALRGRAWASGAKRPVEDLVEEMEAARKERSRAADATDADTFYTHYDRGYEYVDGSTTVTAREALGLDTTVPVHEEDFDSGAEDWGTGGNDGGEEV